MKSILTVASYISSRYEKEYGEPVEEMKLHKLLYIAQRECMIQRNQLLFPEEFEGWRFGPVAPMIRDVYRDQSFPSVAEADMAEYREVLDYVFENFAAMDSFALTRLTQGEICWRKSRKCVLPTANGAITIPNSDILLDAVRIRDRREKWKLSGMI